MIHCDVLIIGNGLAALSLAKQLADHGLTIHILEKKRKLSEVWLENNRQSFKERMENLFPYPDIASLFTPCDQFTSAWSTTVSDNTNSTKRFHFNKTELVASIKKELNLTTYSYQHIQSSEFCDHHWELQIVSETNTAFQIQTKFVVDASGRNAVWASRFHTHHVYMDDHICLSVVYKEHELKTRNSFCIETMKAGWWYMIKREDFMQCSFITSPDKSFSDYQTLFDFHLSGTYYMKGYMHIKKAHRPLWVQDTRTCILHQTSGDQWLVIGDAAYTTDPLCGQGNEMVLDQVYLAKDYILNFFKNKIQSLEAYDKNIHALFFAHQKQIRSFYLMEKRWPQSTFWK